MNLMFKILETKAGVAAISDNCVPIKLRSAVDTPEGLVKLTLERYIRPTFQGGGVILPQIIGVKPSERDCLVFSYLGIYKGLSDAMAKDGKPGKIVGLTDGILAFLSKKGHRLFCLVAGATLPGDPVQVAWAAAMAPSDRQLFRRAFILRGKEVQEQRFPWSAYADVFMRTFDADIWSDQTAWAEVQP